MTLWGGRFGAGPGDVLWSYSVDDSDHRLLEDDVTGSIAHVRMLGETKVLEAAEVERLVDGLTTILEEAEAGEFSFVDSDEDVHTAVERRLGELVGEVAGKLHTARSRNDQIALDVRLWARRSAGGRRKDLLSYALALGDVAETHAETVIPSYTHLQQAQATTLGHHLLAYAWMAVRDAERFADLIGRVDVSPLGAAASAGTSLPIDPEIASRLLGFGKTFRNSLDAVGSRDHLAEYVFCCAQAMVNLSRLAEELILWSGTEFGRVVLDDTVTTGSSALPQKRNPDLAELVRGRSARVIGSLTSMLALQKALPLAYNRDLQEDKRLLFEADDILASSLRAMTAMLDGAVFSGADPSANTASLDLAEVLVERGVPFREAHRLVGGLVLALEQEGRSLDSVTADELTGTHPSFREEDLGLLDPRASVARRKSPGGGSPESVRSQVEELRRLSEAGG